jgi:OmpA-OmpF porin, OOP family
MNIIGSIVRGVLLAFVVSLAACSHGPILRGKVAGAEKLINEAERNGAMKCAPRELAIARSQLKFALTELDQGFLSKASDHLAIAEPNARAAYDLSPPELCTPHEIGDPDTDGDGIPDSRDMCVLEPEDVDGYLDNDGCPDVDNDLDGIPDTADKCPLAPEDPDGYEDTDGCPDLDKIGRAHV